MVSQFRYTVLLRRDEASFVLLHRASHRTRTDDLRITNALLYQLS